MMTRGKKVLRFVGGLIVGALGSATVADWFFALFEWFNVEMDPAEGGGLGPLAWGAMLATWVASGFVGQTMAANVARLPAIIWFVAVVDAAVLLFAYSVVSHPVFLAGAALGFFVAFRLKDSDLLHMAGMASAEPHPRAKQTP